MKARQRLCRDGMVYILLVVMLLWGAPDRVEPIMASWTHRSHISSATITTL